LINQHHLGLFSALLAAGVEFAVVGGVAVNVHGYVRATYDLDIFVRPTVSNAEATFRALEAVGAPTSGLVATDLLDNESHLRFGNQTSHIDLLASIGDLTFDQVWSDRMLVQASGIEIPFISKANLLDSKRKTGRLRDLVDVEELELLPDEWSG
jgi:hypothetical protein